MKKTYITPLSKVIVMKTANLLCASPIGISSKSANNTDALSRSFDFDDEEEY